MQKDVWRRLAALVGALGLAACDPGSPPEAAAPGAPSQEVAEPEAPEAPAEGVSEPEPVEPSAAEVEESPAPPGPEEIAAAEAVAEALREKDPYARATRLAALLKDLGPEGLHGAREALRHPRYSLQRGGAEIELLARFWATHEPEAATRWAIGEAASGYRFSAILSTLGTWAAADPEAALRGLRGIDTRAPHTDEMVQIAVVHGWFEHDPAALARYIRQQEMGYARQRMLSHYVRLLVQERGAEAAIRWAESVPTEEDEAFTRSLYRIVGSALSSFDLDAALRWCEAHCQGEYGRDIPAAIALRWSRLPGGAGPPLEWLASLPEDESKERTVALQTTFGWWMQEHFDEVSAWIESRWSDESAEPWLQHLLPAYVAKLSNEGRGAEGVEWAERVEDERKREMLLVRAARAWRARDEAGAEAWLERSSLPEEAQAQVRDPAPPTMRPRPVRAPEAEAGGAQQKAPEAEAGGAQTPAES